MRFATSVLIASLGSLAAAQLGDLPRCAQQCYGSNMGTCSQLDVACICRNTTLITGLSCCVATTCSAAEQNGTIQLANNLCGAAGVSVPTSAACTGASASSTPMPSSSGSRTSGATAATSASPSGTHASGSPSTSGAASATGNVAARLPMATAGAMGLAVGIMGAVFAL